MTSKDLIQFAKTKAGEDIPTAGRNTTFQVEVAESRLEFVIQSGKRRNESFTWVEKFCEQFETLKSESCSDYPETRNASYLIGLAREYKKKK